MATILVVDDLAVNREFLVTLLGYQGHRILQAVDGAEALRIARAEHPALIISDILMPTMDGYELVRQLRSDPAIAATPVVFYTAHYHKQEAEELARVCGVTHVLQKPAEPEAVTSIVTEALGLPRAAAALPVPFDFDNEHMRLVTDKLAGTVEELSIANERLDMLVQISLQFASERDPVRLIENVCASARELLGAKHAMLAIGNKNERNTLHFTTAGMDSRTIGAIEHPGRFKGMPGRAIDERSTYRFSLVEDLQTFGLPRGYPPASHVLLAPIISLSHGYGWIVLTDKVGAREFSAEDERLLGILAAQVGRVYEHGSLYAELHEIAERFRSLSRQLMETQETERKNLTRELHDRIGPNLAALNMSLELIIRESPSTTISKLRDAQDLVSETVQHTRDIMAELDPPLLEDYGLAAALGEYTADLGRRAGMQIRVVNENDHPRLPYVVKAAFFRIAQEALNNAIKYSRARHIEVRLEATALRVSLSVCDNGIGFDRAKLKPQNRGLAFMEDRALAVSAALEVETFSPDGGTRITVSWQIPDDDQGPDR